MLCQRIRIYILFVVYIVYVYSYLIYIRFICLSADGVMEFCCTRFSPWVTSNGCLLLYTMFNLILYLAELDKRNELPHAISNSIK